MEKKVIAAAAATKEMTSNSETLSGGNSNVENRNRPWILTSLLERRLVKKFDEERAEKAEKIHPDLQELEETV